MCLSLPCPHLPLSLSLILSKIKERERGERKKRSLLGSWLGCLPCLTEKLHMRRSKLTHQLQTSQKSNAFLWSMSQQGVASTSSRPITALEGPDSCLPARAVVSSHCEMRPLKSQANVAAGIFSSGPGVASVSTSGISYGHSFIQPIFTECWLCKALC